MKTIEQYFHMIRFIMLYKVILKFKSVDRATVCEQMKATEQYFQKARFILHNFVPIIHGCG